MLQRLSRGHYLQGKFDFYMQPLQIFAGEKARAVISREGFKASLFSAFLGASGGPKWFVLSGLDKVIFNEFLDLSDGHIDLIGSSVGSFRSACFAQKDPASAITRLQTQYCNETYSDKPSPQEITSKSKFLLKFILDTQNIEEVLNNTKRSIHIIAARCHGLTASENRVLQGIGLFNAALKNYVNRAHISRSFSRVLFHTGKPLQFTERSTFPTEFASLTKANIHQALLASGSIPLVIEGVSNIPGLPPGMFRDGGIIDYHFDFQLNTPGLVLYPHFYSTPIPGWYDKRLKRQCHPDSFDNVVIMAPSPEFVETLPYKRISDRTDFQTMTSEQRIKYWSTIISESDRLAESFLTQISHSDPSTYIKPINLHR